MVRRLMNGYVKATDEGLVRRSCRDTSDSRSLNPISVDVLQATPGSLEPVHYVGRRCEGWSQLRAPSEGGYRLTARSRIGEPGVFPFRCIGWMRETGKLSQAAGSVHRRPAQQGQRPGSAPTSSCSLGIPGTRCQGPCRPTKGRGGPSRAGGSKALRIPGSPWSSTAPLS